MIRFLRFQSNQIAHVQIHCRLKNKILRVICATALIRTIIAALINMSQISWSSTARYFAGCCNATFELANSVSHLGINYYSGLILITLMPSRNLDRTNIAALPDNIGALSNLVRM
jgi:hypothetical protein